MAKYEARAKYSGCKIHLDGPECKDLLAWLRLHETGNATKPMFPYSFTKAVARAIKNLLHEYPHMLEDRSEEEVKVALKKDQLKIKQQLGKLAVGGDWKQVE